MKSFSAAGFISDYSRQRLEYLDSLPLDIRADERTRKIREYGRNYALEAVPGIVSAVSSAAVSSDTALKAMRMRNGLSQSQLAKASGVPLRTIQQYEQRQKDINRARAEYIIAISAALGCEPSSLLEKKQG